MTKVILSITLFFISITSLAVANDIAAIERYLNSLHNVTADFVQTDSQGKQQKGKFFLSRPGKMRWQYEIPKKILIIINNKNLIHFDQQLDQVSYFKNKDYFFSLLAKKHIKLTSEDLLVSNIIQQAKKTLLTIRKKNQLGEAVTIVFSQVKLKLIGLKIIDGANNHVAIEFSNLHEVPSLDSKLFILHNHKISRSNR